MQTITKLILSFLFTKSIITQYFYVLAILTNRTAVIIIIDNCVGY